MSMDAMSYPRVAPLAFIIDDEISAYIILKSDQENNSVPAEIQNLIDTGKFEVAVKRRDEVLEKADYFGRNWAAENLGGMAPTLSVTTEFFGNVYYLDKGLCPVYAECYSNGYIVFIEPYLGPASFFKATYRNIDELVDEFKHTLEPFGAFPTNFDWASKLVSISGVCYNED